MASNSRYKKIVVPIDGSQWSESAIPHAADIAHNNDSEIILLHVFKTPATEYTDSIALSGAEVQIQQLREETKQRLISLRNRLRGQGLACRVQLIEGSGVAPLISDYIRGEGVDLVVMSSHGRTGLARYVFGSVAHKVLQEVDVPVMLIRPGKNN
jgi:nucleotide-binding universal stress UspA family protein